MIITKWKSGGEEAPRAPSIYARAISPEEYHPILIAQGCTHDTCKENKEKRRKYLRVILPLMWNKPRNMVLGGKGSQNIWDGRRREEGLQKALMRPQSLLTTTELQIAATSDP